MSRSEIDTTATMEIAASPAKMAVMALAGLAFVVLGYFMTTAAGTTTRYSAESIRFMGYLSIAFFGPVTAIIVWRMFTQRGTVITLSPKRS